MSSNGPDLAKIQQAVEKSLHEHWGLFLAEGIVLLLLGAGAIIIPPLASVAVTIILGWIFLVSGVVGLFTTFRMQGAPGFWWALISAVLGIVVGVMLLIAPLRALIPLTIMLVAFFIIEGIASIMYALDHKRELSGRWGWMLVSGVVDLILAAVIFAGLPGTAVWAIGLLVGINMIFGGSALIAMALHARGEASS